MVFLFLNLSPCAIKHVLKKISVENRTDKRPLTQDAPHDGRRAEQDGGAFDDELIAVEEITPSPGQLRQ